MAMNPEIVLSSFLRDRDHIVAEELGAAVHCLGLHVTHDELEKFVNKKQNPDLLNWIRNKTKQVLDDAMLQQVIDDILEDISETRWTSSQIRFLTQQLKTKLAEQMRREIGTSKVVRKDEHLDVPTTSEEPVVSSTLYQRLSAAWQGKYVGTVVLDYLLKSLDEYVKGWKEDSAYAAPLTTITQSSGWGKSRSICELATRGVYIVYISFGERGIPHGTPGAKIYFTSVQNNVRKIAAALVECLYNLASETEKGHSPEQLMVQQTSQSENLWRAYDWGRAEKQVSHLPKCKYMDVTFEEWDDGDLKVWIKVKMMDLQKRFNGRLRETGLRILFCFDEAGELFQVDPRLFMVVRRAFSCFPRSQGIFAVLMDTSAKLQMLAPSSRANPSLKGRLPETKVFAPLCLVGVAHFNLNDLISNKCGILGYRDTAKVLFSVGRPLWAACLVGTDAVTIEDAVAYATQKLLGGTSLTNVTKQKTLEESMAIGILSASIGIEVVAWSDLAQTLVASHMRTAVVVSEERDRIFSADVVEPILGEAAARLLVNDSLLLKVLDVLEGVCKQAFVLEGPRVELIGRIILMLAIYDCLRQEGNYSQPILLQRFLTKVCGKEVKCSKGNVFFNRCCVVSGDLTQDILLQCYVGCFAVIPRRNQEGFDFVIPVLYARLDGEFELSASNMGAIPCQFRDRDSYVINSALLVTWAKHFEFSDYKMIVRKRQRLAGNFSDDDEVLQQQVQEFMQFQTKYGEQYINVLMEEPKMDEMYETNLMILQDKITVSQKQYSAANKERRKELTKLNEEAGVQGGESEDSIKISKAIGLYFHLNSPTKSKDKWVVQVEDCIVLHGLKVYSGFLHDDVLNRLEGLRTAYHKLENMAKSEEERGCLERLIWPYFGNFEGNIHG